MRRFYVETIITEKGRISLSASDSMHAAKALRLKPGTRVVLIDPGGKKYIADLLEVDRKRSVVQIISHLEENNESFLKLAVATGFLKEKKMDHIIRQLTELGVTRWHPFFSDRSVPVMDEKKISKKIERWKKISVESLKQCERNLLPVIFEPVDFKTLMVSSDCYSCKLVFHERERESHMIHLVSLISKEAFLVFGPEGGFSDEESDTLKQRGFQFVSLGPRILKAETAIVSGTAIVQHRLGDLN